LFVLTGCEENESGNHYEGDNIEDEVTEVYAVIEEQQSPTPGVWYDNVFVSNYMGITLILKTPWMIMEEQEIEWALGIGGELLTELEEMPELLWEVLEDIELPHMHILNEETGSGVMIVVERLPSYETTLNEREYFENLRDFFEEMGYSNFTIAQNTTKIGENSWHSFSTTTELFDREIRQYYFANKEGRYMRSIIITLYGGDTLEDILSMFTQ